MNQRIALGLAMLAGAAFGATAIQGLHAQAKPQALVVVDISELTDPEGFKGITGSPQTTPWPGSRRKAATTWCAPTRPPPWTEPRQKDTVVIAFDSVEKAQAWNNSAPQAPINALRAKTTKSRSFVVESLGN